MRLRRVILAVATVAVGLLAIALLVLKFSPEVTLRFSQAQLQSKVESGFPKKKCVISACVELMSPRITLTEGSDRIGIETAFLASLGARAMPGTVRLTGKPHYEQGSGNFYLQDVQVSDFSMSGNAPDFDEVVKVRGPAIVAAIMNRFPLYSVQSHPEYGSIAKLALRSVSVVQGQLQVVFVNPLLLLGT